MPPFIPSHQIDELAAVAIAAAAISAALILGLMPVLRRYALARPNARSSHETPTPQGGGIAVIGATLIVSTAIVVSSPESFGGVTQPLILLALSTIALAAIGCIDDIWTIDVRPRLIIQVVAALILVVSLPRDLDVIPALPSWVERLGAVVVGVWLINLVNFMDGIDLLTVVETSAITIGVIFIGFAVPLPAVAILIATALLGATIGFAPFNRPVARLFLGDVGSLPIGLLLFWLLLLLASEGYFAAAILLPLYYVADATVTLLRRAAAGERVTQGHREHFYQQATGRGFSVPQVLVRITSVDGLLIVLALLSVSFRTLAIDVVTLLVGMAAVTALLINLSRGPR